MSYLASELKDPIYQLIRPTSFIFLVLEKEKKRKEKREKKKGERKEKGKKIEYKELLISDQSSSLGALHYLPSRNGRTVATHFLNYPSIATYQIFYYI